MSTIRDRLLQHTNDYGFDVGAALSTVVFPLPSLSVVVPYHESSDTLPLVLSHLAASIASTLEQEPTWKHEIIVVDDGSRIHPASSIISAFKRLSSRLVLLPNNCGRTAARNAGLFQAIYDVCLFLDADVLIDNELIRNVLTLFGTCRRGTDIVPIVPAFFATSSTLPWDTPPLTPNDVVVNDFRVFCTYRSEWIGCEDDSQYIGTTYRLLAETNMFRFWRGKIGPWWLPNMVLGGCFAVDTAASLGARGFDTRFGSYGFTETSLPTKLIALFDHKVVPLIRGGALHVSLAGDASDRVRKDALFRRNHAIFNHEYLNTPCSAVLDSDPSQ